MLLILQLYKRAWEEQNIDLLKQIFAVDAVYVFRPPALAAPLQGLTEIEEYWRKGVMSEQESVRFDILRAVEKGSEIWLEWKAAMVMPMLRPGDDVYPMWGAMVIDLARDGKIQHLVEYYFWDLAQRERLLQARERLAVK